MTNPPDVYLEIPFCKEEEHLFGPCKVCGMPHLASRLMPPTADDIVRAQQVIQRLKDGTDCAST